MDEDKLANPLWPYRAADIEAVTGLKYNAIRLAIGRAEAAIPGFEVRPTARPSAIMMVQLRLYGRLVELGLSALQATYVALNEKLEVEIEHDITKRYPKNAEKTLRENQPEADDDDWAKLIKKDALYDLKADTFLIVSQPQLRVGEVTLSDFDIVTERKLDLLYQPPCTQTMHHGTPYSDYATVHFERRDIAVRTEWVEPYQGKDLWGELPEADRKPLSDAVRLVNLTRLIRSTSIKLMDLYPESSVQIHQMFAGKKSEG